MYLQIRKKKAINKVNFEKTNARMPDDGEQ